MLVVFGGLPGVGKTTVARALARQTGAVHLRIDTIEQALREAGRPVEGQGYRLAYAIAADNLEVGRTVIADCVNPWRLTRDEWRAVGARAGVPVLDVEIVCGDAAEHRRRVEGRISDIPGHRLPDWAAVLSRDYHRRDDERLVVDTAADSLEEVIIAIRRGMLLLERSRRIG